MFHIVSIDWVNDSDDKEADKVLYEIACDAVEDPGYQHARQDKEQQLETDDLEDLVPAGTDRKHGVEFILAQAKRQDNYKSHDKQGSNTHQYKNRIEYLPDPEDIL